MGQECRTEHASEVLADMDGLVRQHRARLLRFVNASVRDEDLACSIVQDSFLKAHQGRHRFRGECSVHTWLVSIALNLVKDSFRSKKHTFWRRAALASIDVSEVARALPDPCSSPERQLLAHEQVAAVSRALQSLSVTQREIFRMRIVHQMNLQEVALAMNMPVNTVKTHFFRAVRKVRAQVREGR